MIFDRLLNPLAQLEKKRLALQRRSASLPEEMNALLSVPLPQADASPAHLEFLVVDFETSGLSPEQNKILTVGTVTLRELRIQLTSASHDYLAQPAAVRRETAGVNHIMPERLIQGISPPLALKNLLTRARGKVMVAHCAAIEQQFLRRLSQDCGLPEPPLVWLDTFMLEKSLSVNRNGAQLHSLPQVRQRYGLPPYPAHDALSDAVATAEVLLCQIKTIFAGERAKLLPLYRRSLTGRP